MPGIIVGVDDSANAKRALEWAITEASARNAPLTVLNVHEVAASFWTHHPVTVPADHALLEEARKAASELVDKVAAGITGARPQITVKAVNGFAAAELIDAASGADLLVVGARGSAHTSGLAGHTPLGSISNKVLHHAQCPVVVVPATA